MYNSTTIGVSGEENTRFSARKGTTHDTVIFSISLGFSTPLVVLMNHKQAQAMAFEFNSYLDSITRAECETCQGTGSLVVSDGETSWSGDDACPNCQEVLA